MFRVTEQIAIKHRHERNSNEIKNARPCPKKTVSRILTFFKEKYGFIVLFSLDVFGVSFCREYYIHCISTRKTRNSLHLGILMKYTFLTKQTLYICIYIALPYITNILYVNPLIPNTTIF